MGFLRLVYFASLLAAFTHASPLAKRDQTVVSGSLGTDGYWNDYDGGLNNYTQHDGNGSIAEGWPSVLTWASFNDLWVANQHIISRSCSQLYNTPNNSDQEIQDLYNSIKQVAHDTRVDKRFILAAILQETKGCVRAKTTTSSDGITNPGLLQSFKGNHSCNDNGKVQNPCPQDQILGMISDGVAGTGTEQGYATDINAQADVNGIEYAQAYYRAARLYNSGTIDSSGDLGKGSATHCYSSDIANRLVGWTDSASTCTLDD
ncbi:hypothetical protein LTR10_019545 [Elasticomyces elasticus]|uniref:Transglycosylase SLT domain-containing protein n=1 Tax=Exophiala sideris TaxID=1016849 RepID=A0ABR0J526_9EURO|nr:hypothetical protein LTR10_019545 [Elasticomyces elasticus]KAK5035848.1 hypothetical protein LTR13_005418 [Exophiala sideris]KAK5056884.1 hypothetical protein LTR69_007522 [Exophiala sideris]KAK5181291.1 hypothetical protein LTR44_006086 [Eurotiomycetes sp. CCFEE 6388]